MKVSEKEMHDAKLPIMLYVTCRVDCAVSLMLMRCVGSQP
jgi:hypothetical protein